MRVPRSIRARCRRQSPWRSPWKTDRVRRNVASTRYPVWVRSLREETGVYLIRDAETKEMLYVGRGTSCLKSALVRHFRSWGEDRRGPHRRVVFDRCSVEVKVYLIRREWCRVTEADLIARYLPQENGRPEALSRYARYEEVPF